MGAGRIYCSLHGGGVDLLQFAWGRGGSTAVCMGAGRIYCSLHEDGAGQVYCSLHGGGGVATHFHTFHIGALSSLLTDTKLLKHFF